MRYMILMIVMVVSLSAMEKGTIVSEKDVDGVHISLVKVNAEVLPNFGKENKYDGTKSLVFYKLDGSPGLSKSTYKAVPNEHNKHVTVYYVEKSNEKNKYAYAIFFNRNNVLFEKQEEVKLLDNNLRMTTPLSATKKTSSVNENQTDIFYLSLYSLGFFIAAIWIFFNSSGNIFSNIFFLKDRKKVSKKLFIIAMLVFIYCIIWFSFLKEFLSLEKITILETLFKTGLFVFMLSIYHLFMSLNNNDVSIFSNSFDEDDEYSLNRDTYDDKFDTSNDVAKEHKDGDFKRENDFSDFNSTENNVTDEVADFDDD